MTGSANGPHAQDASRYPAALPCAPGFGTIPVAHPWVNEGDWTTLANTKSAIKAARQAEKRRVANRSVRTRVKNASKAVATAVSGGAEGAASALRTAQSVIDRAAKRGVLHPRAAARRKSRLMKKLNAAAK